VIGTLLAGIVALNVAALQLRIERGKVTADIAKIRAENESLRAELSSARAPGRVEASALADFGLVEAGNPTYVKLPPPGR
jgi:cell division protein FtsB